MTTVPLTVLPLTGALMDIPSGVEPGVKVNAIIAVAIFVASARLVAVTVTLCALLIVAGAAYKPALETEPGPLRDQETPVLLDPVTVTVNCCV